MLNNNYKIPIWANIVINNWTKHTFIEISLIKLCAQIKFLPSKINFGQQIEIFRTFTKILVDK